MTCVEGLTVISSDETNKILGAKPRSCRNTTVEFIGKNNILYLEEGVHIRKTKIRFKGDNAILYLSKSRHWFIADVSLDTNAACVIGHNIFMNRTKPLKILVREDSSLVIGNDGLFSLAIKIDTRADGNPKSILIDQHVWLGQKVRIQGGSRIMSGAVIGSNTEIRGQQIPANSCWASRNGELKMLYDDIVFIKKTVRNTSKEDAVTNDFISEADLQEIQDVTKDSLDWVLDLVERAETPEEKLRLLESTKDKRSYNQPKYEDPEEDESDQDDLEGSGNQVIGSYTALDTKVNFRGKGNVLIVEDGVTLEDSRIGFKGDNSIVYLSKAEQPYRIQVTMHTDTNLYIGENSRFTQDKPVTMSIAEAQSVLIGDNCSFGKGCWFRTSDQHPIYDQKTRKRLNQPKSILVGDNVTLPDKSLVFKGRKIGVEEDDARGNKYVNALKELQETTEQSVRIELMRKLKFDQ